MLGSELLARGAAAANYGFTPLSIAIQEHRLEVVRELLARGAAVDAAQTDGWTSLHIACDHGYTEFVRALLAHGASSSRENYGSTLLSLATSLGHTATAALLSTIG